MINIEREKIDLALYVINLKIAKVIKNTKTYSELKEKIETLEKEKEEIYKQNEKVIGMVLDKYLKEIKQ